MEFGGHYDGEFCPSGCGTVFRMTLSGDVTVFHRFRNDTDGANPESSLTAGGDAALYGTTYTGVYRITPSGAFEMAHVLGPDEGFFANDVVRAGDGFLYGTASQGQDSEFYGTIFRLSTNGDFTTLYRFHSADGASPAGPLLQASDGRLYGVTLESGQGSGTVFRFDPAKGLTTMHAFRLPRQTAGCIFIQSRSKLAADGLAAHHRSRRSRRVLRRRRTARRSVAAR